MKNKRIVKPKLNKNVQKAYKGLFSTIKFADTLNGKLFECIPDNWFIDEGKEACYWPPKTGKSFSYRALNGEIPDNTWEVFACEIVSEDHPTYSSGFKVVREKCSQKYNTSSADEEIQAAMFRRKHPGLTMQNQKGFEQIFDEPSQCPDKPNKEQQTCGTTNDKTSTSNCENQLQMDSHELFDNTQPIKSGDLRLNNEKNQTSMENTNPSNNILPDHSLRSASLARSSRSRPRSKQSRSSYISRPSSASSFHRNSSEKEQPRCSNDLSSRNRLKVADTNNETTWRSKGASNSNGRARPMRPRSRTRSRSRSKQSHSSYNIRMSPPPTFRRNSSQEKLSRNSKDFSSRNRSNVAVTNSKDTGRNEGASHSNGRKRSMPTRSRSMTRSQSKMRSRTRSRSSTPRTRRGSNSRKTYSKIRRRRQSNSIVNSSSSSSKSSTNGCGKRNGYINRSTSESITHSFVSETRQSSVATRYIHQRKSDTRASSNTHRRVSNNSYELSHAQQSHAISSNTYNAHDTNLLAHVQKLTKSVEKINQHLSANDQRFDRMEVTINKMFVLLGDIALGRHSPMHINDASGNDEDFDVPNLPIKNTDKLAIFQSKLKNKDFRNFLIKREKEFCSPSGRQTDTVTMTKYLQRFVTLRVRCKLTLKEKGESGITLFDNYNRVYLFLVDVMKEGYKLRNKKIISDDAHQALRIVWGRSKQLMNEQEKKLANKEKKKRSRK